jgi:NAD-dependent protein deacetylase sirtuin 5
LWRGHRAAGLSSAEAWGCNPGLVWKYFAHRRRLALGAGVNEWHRVLAVGVYSTAFLRWREG